VVLGKGMVDKLPDCLESRQVDLDVLSFQKLLKCSVVGGMDRSCTGEEVVDRMTWLWDVLWWPERGGSRGW
jgi:hypothetical protein